MCSVFIIDGMSLRTESLNLFASGEEASAWAGGGELRLMSCKVARFM